MRLQWKFIFCSMLGSGALLVRLVALLVLACAFANHAHGQAVSATVVGRVADGTGAAIIGASVSIDDSSVGVHRSTETSSEGQFEFPLVVPGEYRLTVQAKGFKTSVVNGLLVVVNSTTRRDVQLSISQDVQSIEVTAAPPEMQTDRADITSNFEPRQVADLPLSGNMNFETIQNLVPGVSRAVFLNTVFTNAQSTLSNYVNGQSKLANNLEIEGIGDNARVGEFQLYMPPAEAIETVNVNTGNYAPEFGLSSGYVTNVIIKSGSDKFHGSAYEYNRVAALTAKNYFNTNSPVTPLVYNYYGGTVSGPIFKNKTFFFADFLRTDDHEGTAFTTYTVPTKDYRSGNLSASSSAIYDPATGTQGCNTAATCKTRKQFAYNGVANTIDPTRISSIATYLLKQIPLPNYGAPGALTNNYARNTANNKDYYNYDLKLDQNLFASDRLSYRFSDEHIATYEQPIFGVWGGPAQSGSEGNGTVDIYTTAANYVHIFSPNLIAEARLGMTHYRNLVALADGGQTLDTVAGIMNANLGSSTSGPSTISLNGYNAVLLGYNKNFPTERGETHLDAVNDWTKIWGRHTIKFGFEYQRIRDDLAANGSYPARGIFNFADGTTSNGSKTSQGNDFASFLLDLPTSLGRTIQVQEATWRQNYFIGYVQDTYQVTNKLTATYGVRWDLYSSPVPRHTGGYTQYDPTTDSLIVGGIATGMGNNLNVVTRYANFAPRIGLAYRPTQSTVVRGGYGTSYYPLIGDSYGYYNFPYTQDSYYTGASTYQPDAVTMDTGLPALNPISIPANGIISMYNNAAAPLLNSSSTYVVNQQQKIPYVEFWNATIEQTLPASFDLNVAYVGNIGVDSPTTYNLNAATTPGLGSAGQPEYAAFGRTATTNYIGGATTTHYHSLQVRLDRRMKHGLGITSSYTFGKALSYKSDATAVASLAQYINPRSNYGRSSWDRTHTLVQSVIYELPFGANKPWLNSGMASKLAGGWQVTGIVTEMSGVPMTFTASGTSLNAPGNTQFANQVAPFHVLKGIGSSNWFDPTSFSQPTTAALGNTRNGMYSGPGFFNLDAAVFRKFSINDRLGMEFRAEAFGLTNTPQFANPDTLISDATFGQITAAQGATGSRILQLSGKFSF